jgi:hypothetical protein
LPHDKIEDRRQYPAVIKVQDGLPRATVGASGQFGTDPTRAALLTGRNHRAVGYGNIAEAGLGYPGYDTVTGRESAHVAMTLKQNGYATACTAPGSLDTSLI